MRYWNIKAKSHAEEKESRLAQSTQFNNFCCFNKYIKNKSRPYHLKILLKQTNKQTKKTNSKTSKGNKIWRLEIGKKGERNRERAERERERDRERDELV